MKEAIVIFTILLLLLLIISVFGGSIRYTPTKPAPGSGMPFMGANGYPMGFSEQFATAAPRPKEKFDSPPGAMPAAMPGALSATGTKMSPPAPSKPAPPSPSPSASAPGTGTGTGTGPVPASPGGASAATPGSHVEAFQNQTYAPF
jgi:hypothetical protein